MLREIRQLLQEHGQLSLRELASHFSMTTDAIEPMLELLIQKHKIRLTDFDCSSGKSCSGCTCVSREDMLQYKIKKNDQTGMSGAWRTISPLTK